MTTAQPYEVSPVLDRVLAPFERWADSGYAEGVIDFLPSLGSTPLLLSPSSLSSVFNAAMMGLDPENATESDKEEAARRFEFIERLVNQLMTRENRIRDRYYDARRKGMLHRTIVMLACMGVLVASSLALPAWGLFAVSGLLAAAGAVGYHRFRKTARSLKSIYLFEGRGQLIIRELPWMADAERISPRPPLEEAE